MSCTVKHKDGSVEVFDDATCGNALGNVQSWLKANPTKVNILVAALTGAAVSDGFSSLRTLLGLLL